MAYAVSPLDGSSNALWRTIDSGYTWHQLKAPSLGAFAAGNFDSGVLYGYSKIDGSLQLSRDGGLSWVPTRPLPSSCDAIAALGTFPQSPNIVLVAARCGIMRSADYGGSWALVRASHAAWIETSIHSPGRVVASGAASDDFGATWSPFPTSSHA